jgi:hypothetical protein
MKLRRRGPVTCSLPARRPMAAVTAEFRPIPITTSWSARIGRAAGVSALAISLSLVERQDRFSRRSLRHHSA